MAIDDHHPHQQDHAAINRSSSPPVAVVMVPFPAHSHLNQLLQLSHIISSHNNIKVHYVGFSVHNSQVKSRATHVLNPERIEFHDFPTPDHFQSPPPNDTKFPSHLLPSFEAFTNLRQPVKSLLTSLSETARRVVVIHDLLISSVVQDASSLPNTEAYIFNAISAVSKFAFLRDVMGFKPGSHREIPPYEGRCSAEFEAFVDYQFQFVPVNKSGHLFNTSRPLESDFLDLILEKETEINREMKLWAIGPLETVTIFKQISNSSSRKQKDCLEWLDRQRPSSVLYVSFGTTTFMENEQIRELALGLEQSEVNFLWVLRDADKGNVFDEVRRPQLPDGFEERVKEKGMVVRDWAPQLEILGHSSTGGFLSHCGWNSCLESLSLGVPIAAWPIHTDQPISAALITEVLKVGVFVRNRGQSDELVSSSAVRDAVKRLMASEEGDEMRKRAEKLGCELRKATAEGGVSRMELDSFVAHITR